MQVDVLSQQGLHLEYHSPATRPTTHQGFLKTPQSQGKPFEDYTVPFIFVSGLLTPCLPLSLRCPPSLYLLVARQM